MKFDIAIIGGGPAGYTAAERAGANGLKAVLFEKKAIGGVRKTLSELWKLRLQEATI